MTDWANDTGNARPAQSLPPITVTASRTTWWIDDVEFMLGARRHNSFSELVTWEYYLTDGPDCAEESELYLAEDALLDQMEEEAELMRRAIEAVQPLQCEPKPGFDICFDFFIMNRRSFVFSGNDRDFNPYAGISQSKAQLYLNTSSLAKDALINDTRLLMNNTEIMPRQDSSLFRINEDYLVSRSSDTIFVTVTARNNYCVSRSGCPSINAHIQLIQDPAQPHGYKVRWQRDAYPSMGIYKTTDGGVTYHTLAEDPENGMGPWLAWTALIGERRQSLHMPPQCSLQ